MTRQQPVADDAVDDEDKSTLKGTVAADESPSVSLDEAGVAAGASNNNNNNNNNDANTSNSIRSIISSTSSRFSSSSKSTNHRDPFFAFIPQLTRWGCGVVGSELNYARKGLVAFPSWSKNFSVETYTYYRANPRILLDEIISGFTVAIMQVPESIAFSFVAGVPPLSGLHATFWLATITGLLGGKPGMISGAAGALAVVVADLTADDGVLQYLQPAQRLDVLYMTMFVCGWFQIIFAWLRLAKLVRLIPETGTWSPDCRCAVVVFGLSVVCFCCLYMLWRR